MKEGGGRREGGREEGGGRIEFLLLVLHNSL